MTARTAEDHAPSRTVEAWPGETLAVEASALRRRVAT
jgi:hypothetical protein